MLPEEDKNHQACGTALERDIKLAGEVDSAAEYDETQVIEPLEEDKDRQTCEMVLKKVDCPYEGCDWVRKFLWSPAIADMPPEVTADMPPEVTEACQHMYDVHDIYTMPPRVEEAEPPKEDRWTCKRVPEMVTLAWLVPRLHQYAAEDWLDPRTETCSPPRIAWTRLSEKRGLPQQRITWTCSGRRGW